MIKLKDLEKCVDASLKVCAVSNVSFVLNWFLLEDQF